MRSPNQHCVGNNTEATAKKLGGVTGKGFKPGRSGNPSGRPKGLVSKALLRHLRTKTGDKRELDAVVEAIVNTAKKGNAQAFCAIRDTVDGPPKQEGAERGPAVLIQFIRDPQTPAIQVAVKPEI